MGQTVVVCGQVRTLAAFLRGRGRAAEAEVLERRLVVNVAR